MTKRNPVTTALMMLIPLYGLIWFISTKREMNKNYGTKAVTTWVMLIPGIGPLWLLFSYAGAAAKVHGQLSPIAGGFVFFIPFLGPYLHQKGFNDAAPAGMQGQQLRAA